MIDDPYRAAQASAARLAELSGQDRHDVAVVLGSGFAQAAAALGPADAEIPLADLGGFPPPTVAGHVAMARSLTIGGRRVLVYLGRVHLYEGNPPRFADLSEVYSARLRALARASDPSLADGVYAALPGPHYETPAEIRMLRTVGADLVGMSTALEAIAARHLGAEVLAISLVSNLAAGLAPDGLDHAEVLAAGQEATERMGSLLAGLLPDLLPDPAP